MTVPRRMRFEVLRRDGHRCRYCGATPQDTEGVKLTVDHVIPEGLGGPTVPENLITACDPCNSGKASVPPDAATVAEVNGRALRWREAIRQAAAEAAEDRRVLTGIADAVLIEWVMYECEIHGTDTDGAPAHLPPDNYPDSVRRWIEAGLTQRDLVELVAVAWRSHVRCENLWRYYAGCCWRRVTELQERALTLVEGG